MSADTPREDAAREREREIAQALEDIAQIAWRGFGHSPECKQIYAICRDRIGVMAGKVWRR